MECAIALSDGADENEVYDESDEDEECATLS
jgi:hypothetical protein